MSDKYSITVSNSNITATLAQSTQTLSLARTGGQGSKGDSISNVYVDGSNNLLVDISNSGGDLLETINVGNIDLLITSAVNAQVDAAVGNGENTYITVSLSGETDAFDFTVELPMAGITDVEVAGLSDGKVLAFNSTSSKWEPVDLDTLYYTEAEADALLSGKSDTGHTHALTDLSNVNTAGAVSGYALSYNGTSWVPTNLDLTYATDGALIVGLASKSNIGHTHTLNNLSNVNAEVVSNNWVLQYSSAISAWQASALSVAEVDGLQAALDSKLDSAELDLKSDVGHTHDDLYYTETEVDNFLLGKSNTGHLHDDRYYTEAEVDSLLTSKSDTTHDHSGVYEPADATILKDADIGVTVQAYNANYVVDGAYVHTDNNFTTVLKDKLDGAAVYDVTTSSTGYFKVSVGTTAQRPTASVGMVRYNTTRGCFEGYTGSGWVNMSPLTIDGVGEIV